MTNKFKAKHIILELDRNVYNIVFKILTYLTDNIGNHAIVDSNRLCMGKQAAESIVKLLEAANCDDKSSIILNMNTSDWASYMINYSACVLPLPHYCNKETEDFLKSYLRHLEKEEDQPNFYDETIIKRVASFT
jgi:hypothetical protein